MTQTPTQQEFDARGFLHALYPDVPGGMVIALGSLTKPHFVRAPDDALPYVVGKRDIYTRITLLRGRPERRGLAEDSAALPGVWLEVDVAGGPASHGSVVSGGAPDIRTALDLCHRVLQPTLMVRSGYGVHAYWLFVAPWIFANAAQRELGAELVAGWQRRMRREAREIGVEKLDATHDLSRVLRVPGTFNGKGSEPVPVVLLDDGGPRYSMLEIERHCDPPEARVEVNGDASSAATPDELLTRYPKLARIVHREGDAPGDGTGHAWDWYLACEARRRGVGRSETIALLAHARARHGEHKGDRTDYLERTVDKAFAEVAAPVNASGPANRSSEAIGAWISQQWRDDRDDPIVEGWTKGYGDAAIVYLRRRDGTVLRFPRLADFFEPATHIRRVSLIARAPCPPFTKEQAVRIAQQVIALCDAHASSEVSREELRDWLDVFIAGLGATTLGELNEPGHERWHALNSIVSFQPENARGVAAQTAAVRDASNRLWLPAESLMRHVRYVEREQIDWETLNTRMLDLGWERREISQWQPELDRSVARQIRRVFYVQPPGEAGEAGEATGGEAGEE